jgi:hypothetical protein
MNLTFANVLCAPLGVFRADSVGSGVPNCLVLLGSARSSKLEGIAWAGSRSARLVNAPSEPPRMLGGGVACETRSASRPPRPPEHERGDPTRFWKGAGRQPGRFTARLRVASGRAPEEIPSRQVPRSARPGERCARLGDAGARRWQHARPGAQAGAIPRQPFFDPAPYR